MSTAEEELSSIRQRLELLSSNGNVLSIGFFNAAALKLLEASVSNALVSARSKTRQDYHKLIKEEKILTEPDIDTLLDKHRKESTKAQEKLYNKYAGKLGSALSKFNELKNIFGPGNEFARNLFLASKAFEAGTSILKKVFQSSVTYLDAAKDLSDAGLMIGSTTNMLYKTAEGTYKRFSDGTTDFNAIITHSANLAGIRLEDFGDKLKENSSFLTRMYSMGVEGTAELGNLYATVAKRAGDMSQRNADTVVKQWAGAIQPLYTTEEIMSNKLNTSFDNLVETMNYFMKATGKSAENILKENEIKEKTLALERITAENPQIVSALKSVGYSDDMIMAALTGRITKELNMQLMNSPNFATGFRNVQQMIQQHATDGYLNTDEGRRLFANTVLASVNNAQSDIRNIRNMSDYLTRRSYASYDYIRQIEAVGRLRTNAINPNANVLGQNSSQTAAVEAANELNRDTNKIVNDIKNILSPGMDNIASILNIMDGFVGAGRWGTNLISSNPIVNSLVSGLIWGGSATLTGWGAVRGIGAMMGLGKGLSASSGTLNAGAGATAGLISKIPAGVRTTGRILGGVGGVGFGLYDIYDAYRDYDKNSSGLTQGLRIGQSLSGLASVIGGGLLIAGTGGLAAPILLGAGALGGLTFGALADASEGGSKLEESARRGSTEGQPYYFNSPEIVNKLNQIQTVCQSLYGVACMNKQMNTFARMDAVSASYK